MEVARSTCPSQKCKKLTGSDHFWKLRCRKSACRCGAKHISKSKCTKHTRFGPFLEVEMKKCTPLWHEAHFEVKMYKTLWREAHFELKELKAPGVRTTFGGSDVAPLRFTTIHYITLHYTPQHYNYNYNCTTTQLHSTTLH